ncbi:MAG: GTP-binding protein [Xanthomonadales bacterium]|nr:GTP-binding protein [Xanthomonadales bacterium]
MTIWKRAQSGLRNWRSRAENAKKTHPDEHLLDANRNLRELIEDSSIPAAIRVELATEFKEIEALSRKLRRGEIHVAAFGRVGVGKSSLLNALLRREAFHTSPLHGETRQEAHEPWHSVEQGHTVLIDTPGIDEMDGAQRERLARSVSRRADVILMVCDSDLTEREFKALRELCGAQRAVILVLNKADRYTEPERDLLLERLRERCEGLLPPKRVIAASAAPRPELVIRVDAKGREIEEWRARPTDTTGLKEVLWRLLEKEGKTLAALNAALFASELDRQVATRIVEARKAVADRLIHKYCLAKGLLVAANPVPAADLLAAAGSDLGLVIHLGEIYGFRPSRREASRLLLTISAQLAVLMGAYWGTNLVASALKIASAGLSTALTAGAQGTLAWYATYLTGRMAQSWFASGKSWGEAGPRATARAILASLDRESMLQTANRELSQRLKSSSG